MDKPLVRCFHCAEPCVSVDEITIELEEGAFPVCCQGCRAICELIHLSGMQRYYRFREGQGRKADEDQEELEAAWGRCDERRALWGDPRDKDRYDLLILAEGVRCGACGWLIRNHLEALEGIDSVQVDLESGYTRILWRPDQTRLSRIARELLRIGYRPHLPLAEAEERGRLRERREAMIRLGVAGLGMMQVMMYAVGLYAGEALGMSAGAERFLQWTSLLVTLPVLFYSGRPFFINAVSALRRGMLDMDVPVALAMSVAFLASCINFFRGSGDVYFDSVVMFVFFLTAARFIQMSHRHRNLQSSAAIARLLPEWARRQENGQWQTVLLDELSPQDRVMVRAGEAFPADGLLVSGDTQVDESLLTGESQWHLKRTGDAVVGGSVNRSRAVEMEISATGPDTIVSALGRLVLRAQVQGSRMTDLASRVARIFVFAILVLAAGTGGLWWWLDPERALSAVLAVLVVSCPCALSLAFPTALAAAARGLRAEGVLLTRADALESLARVNLIAFDKTGTLTQGAPERAAMTINEAHPSVPDRASEVVGQELLEVAAALEAHSAHPLSNAFNDVSTAQTAVDVELHLGQGLTGVVRGKKWRMGSAGFIGVSRPPKTDRSLVWLADEAGWIARFEIQDQLRPGGFALMDWLRSAGISTAILSGDAQPAVEAVADRLKVDSFHSTMSPDEKLRQVEHWRREGRTVLMLGDGVNDGPVLAAAQVSMTVTGAAELANSAADLILARPSLEGVRSAMEQARFTRRIVRQNLGWAVTYNLLALPLAISGALAPWMAALGMSVSSLLVVINSSRLSRGPSHHRSDAIPETLGTQAGLST